VEPLPAILDEYERHREDLLKNREWYLRYLKEHPGFAELLASFTGRRAADLGGGRSTSISTSAPRTKR
jgi:hypothetical protein